VTDSDDKTNIAIVRPLVSGAHDIDNVSGGERYQRKATQAIEQ